MKALRCGFTGAASPPRLHGALRAAHTLLFAVFAIASLAAREVAPKEVDAIFARWDKPGSPGMAVAVIRDGAIIYERGYGRANIEDDVPVTPATVFYVGSVSKQFTAACIALLAQRGVISLDDDVRKYVPELRDYGTRITIQHLVHHTSGLRDYLALRDLAGEAAESVFNSADALALIARQKALNSMPGAEYIYSNSGFFLLGLIVQRTSGKSLRDFAAENIFRPLGMTTAQFRDDHTMAIEQRANGYAPRPDGGFRVSNPNFDVVGAGGLFMTVRDFFAWDQNFYSGKVGGAELIALVQTPTTLNDGSRLDYGFGLMLGNYRGLRIVEHSGAYGGFRAHVIRFPEQHFSVACFTNLSTNVPGELVRRVAGLYLADVKGAPPVPAAATKTSGIPAGSAKSEKPLKPAALTAEQLQAYAGDYFSDELDVIGRIIKTGSDLAFQRGPAAPVKLIPGSHDEFRVAGAIVRFQRDSHGTITALTLEAGRIRGLVFARR